MYSIKAYSNARLEHKIHVQIHAITWSITNSVIVLAKPKSGAPGPGCLKPAQAYPG